MKTIKWGNNFKKHLKKVRSYKSFREQKLNDVLLKLINGELLDRVYDDHPVSKVSPKHLQGKRILHLAPNICLIYSNTNDTIYLEDIGSHQDLELTESLEDLVRVNGSKYLNWLINRFA